MEDIFNGVYKNKRVLITGHTGFKGSWLAIWLKELGAEVYGYALKPKTELDNFNRCALEKQIHHQVGDVTDYQLFQSFGREVKPDVVFHLAAQPLVLQSYDDPRETYHTNLMGTVNFLEIVRGLPSVKAALNVTSDKCYENKEWVWGYRESDPMGGKDPYSSSKGCSELITSAYTHSFFQADNTCNVASARAGNVIGGGDWADNRIVPDFFRAQQAGVSLVVRNPQHTRPWQHVLEPLSGYLQLAGALLTSGKKFSGGWNFGPSDHNNHSVETLIQSIIKKSAKGSFTSPSNTNKPYEAQLLKLDVSKAGKFLAWSPALSFDQTVAFTVKGYQDEFEQGSLYEKRVSQIKEYVGLASKMSINWAN